MSNRDADLSPLGSTHAVAADRRRARHPDYQRAHLRHEMAETIARFLIGYRQRYGLTQAQLGARLGMKDSAISRLESGDHVPNADTLQRIKEGCGAEITFAMSESSGAHELASV
jgi:ribosome-binding protein aMBF1 (putative translation factor)